MCILGQISKILHGSSQQIKDSVADYVSVNPQSKQLILRPKATSFLCQQAVAKVDQLKSLEPDAEEGLIAEVEYEGVEAKVHFTPEKIFIKDDTVEGQLRLIEKPEFESDSLVYKILIAGWSTILGGYVPENALPEGIRIDGDQVYYRLPKSKLKLLGALSSKLEEGSALNLDLIRGELKMSGDVSIDWDDLNFKNLSQIF